ncbi:SRPBCC domain-containing protein [Microbacterium sp. HD4P20]|uniref:SRPBCC domain-containing protein n=1 Tax=Microbacterium sp. HD4P20 TaxID=2864874 RepID=UPI001C63C6DC|nr:SRPBCC domain-containing protein [Microbacterium sp. HD4P20]MCP2636218.1 SRPBCC domain-containing protein [Microbacterium sp. HD4P20]
MVDVNAQIDAVTRGVRTADMDGEPSHVQTLTQEYPSPIEDVWDAVTSPERIPRWFLPVAGELRAGGHYQLEGNAGGDVLTCDPPRDGAAGYRVTWEYGGGVSWVAVRLVATGEDTTRLELEHTARAADVPPGFWEQFGPGATGVGWDGGLLGLALHLGGSDALPPGAAEEWAATEEGKAFYRGAATAWGAAHAASGADASEAAQAADNTFAFYTGQLPVDMPES